MNAMINKILTLPLSAICKRESVGAAIANPVGKTLNKTYEEQRTEGFILADAYLSPPTDPTAIVLCFQKD